MPARVLHVDDEPGFAETVATFLERESDMSVQTATNAADGLDRLGGGEFDCIVSGYEMPGQNGIEFLEASREACPEIPFILYTGKGSEKIASEAISAGVTDYFRKDRGTEQYTALADRITSAVEARRSEDARGKHESPAEPLSTDGVFRSLAEPLYAFDPDGNPLRWNERFEAVTGYSGEEIQRMALEEFVPEREAERVATTVRTVLEEGRSAVVRSALETKSGERVPYELTVCPLEDADGTVHGVVGIGRNSTGQKERRRELRLFRKAVENTGHSIYVTDRNGTIEYVNPAFEEATGYSAAEAIGMTPRILKSGEHDREFYEELWDTILSGDVWRNEIINKTKSGDRCVVDQTIAPLENDAGDITHFVAINADITSQHEFEETIKRQNDRLEEFASFLTHDLRNPLSVAEGRLELARNECDSEHHDAVANALNRMDRLINDVLLLTRERRDIGTTEPVAFRESVEAAWAMVTDKADGAELVYAGTSESAVIQADSSRLRQVLENLLVNAIEHGGTDVTVRIETTATGFAIEDDGPGVPQEDRHRVFDTGHTTSEEGTGVGLRIVERIVEAHGWDIRVTDGIDGGARFEITGVEFVEK
jgi:PAS domain S-box-containing protein